MLPRTTKKEVAPKLAVALQMWEGDSIIAQSLLSLICDLEREMRDDIEFIVSGRRGTSIDLMKAMVATAKTRFKTVHMIECKRFGSGWPEGSNDTWQESMLRISQFSKRGDIKATGALTMEPDCVPLRHDWLSLIAKEWKTAEDNEYECLGHAYVDSPEIGDHINGNGVFSTDILRNHQELNGCDSWGGWDLLHGKLLIKIGVDTPLITQIYKKESITKEELLAVRKDGKIPALLHGVKGTSAIQIVRAMMNDGSFFNR